MRENQKRLQKKQFSSQNLKVINETIYITQNSKELNPPRDEALHCFRVWNAFCSIGIF